MINYRFYTGNNKVIAVSSYAGKSVKGSAKCDPRDEFDLEKGKQLAAARCNAKVAAKRMSRAQKEVAKAAHEFEKAKRRYEAMQKYLADSIDAEAAAKDSVVDILETM